MSPGNETACPSTQSDRRVRLRLLAGATALLAGVAALVIAILLVKSVLG